MRRTVRLGAVYILPAGAVLVILHVVTTSNHSQDASPLRVTGPTDVLGPVTAGERLTVPFQVQNTSARSVEIGSHSAPCHCTVVGAVPESIPPHGTAIVTLNVDTTGKYGVTEFRAKLFGHSYTHLVAELRALVRVTSESVEQQVRIDAVPAGRHVSRVMSLDGLPGDRLTGFQILSSCPLAVKARPGPRRDQVNLMISGTTPVVSPLDKSLSLQTDVLLLFDAPEVHRARLHIVANVVPDWTVSTPVIIYCADNQGRRQASFLVTCRFDQGSSDAVPTVSVARKSTSMHATIEPCHEHSFNVILEYDPSRVSRSGETITLSLKNGTSETPVEVPLIVITEPVS